MTPSPERDHAATPSSALLTETLAELLCFGAQMLRAAIPRSGCANRWVRPLEEQLKTFLELLGRWAF